MMLGGMKQGQAGRVAGFADGTAPGYRAQLLAMGFTPGAAVRVERVAPMGCPIEVCVRGARVSLRRDEAAVVEVTRDE
jgi:ferrous iron transport protein A